MLIYIILVIVILLCSGNYLFDNKRLSKSIAIIGMACMVTISLLRFDVGYDYSSYYSNVFPNLDVDSVNRLEPAGKWITILAYNAKFPHLQFILYGLITYFFIFTAIWQYSPNVGISCIVYLALFYLDSFGIVRQASAVAIILYSYGYIVKRSILKFYLCVLLATLFHFSAIICIIFYPLMNWVKLKTMFISIVGAIIFFKIALDLLLSYSIFGTYAFTLNHMDKLGGGGDMVKYVYLIICVIMLIITHRKKETTALRFTILSVIGVSAPFLLGGHIGGRLSDYFEVFYCLTIPKVLQYYKFSVRRVVCEGLGLYFLLGIYVSTTNPTKQPYTPYQTILTADFKSPKFK